MKPEQYLVIGPNKFFVNYISAVLPDLDVENVKQLTYEELCIEALKEDLKLIKKEKIFSYLTSPLYDEVINADKVYKEYQVNFKIPSSYYDKTLKSGNILTSGVIDLLFLSSNCYYIVDYKTDDVEDINELVNRYKVQLDLYEIAIKEKFNAKSIRKFIYSIKLNKFIEL